MTQSGTQSQNSETEEQTSIWSRAFEEVQRARDTGTTPDPEVFQALTKSAGGD